jgi:hypothetical protein
MSKARGLADLGNVYSDGALSNRSLIINGAMTVAQRGTSFTGVNSTNFTCDRFKCLIAAGTMGAYTISQDADAPSGFANSLKYENTIANASPIAGAYNVLFYTFEGQDLQRIGKGTADAQQVTLSFWVKSNKTGTYQVNLNEDAYSNQRMVGDTYAVSVSGTWEKKTITFPADTVGAFADDNLGAMQIEWWFGSGSTFSSGDVPAVWETMNNADRNAGSNVNLADTVGNYIQITGVQLEVGDTATPFEHRSYGQELALCLRYFNKLTYGANDTPILNAAYYNSAGAYGSVSLQTEMRVYPTLVVSAASDFKSLSNGSSKIPTSINISGSSTKNPELVFATAGHVQGHAAFLRTNNTSAVMTLDAEL